MYPRCREMWYFGSNIFPFFLKTFLLFLVSNLSCRKELNFISYIFFLDLLTIKKYLLRSYLFNFFSFFFTFFQVLKKIHIKRHFYPILANLNIISVILKLLLYIQQYYKKVQKICKNCNAIINGHSSLRKLIFRYSLVL